MNAWLKAMSEPMNTVDFRLNLSYPEIGDFLAIVIICGISILLAAIWVLAIGSLARSRGSHLTGSLERLHCSR